MTADVHKSLHRPQFFLGVDRELCMYTILISFITGFGGYNLTAALAAIVFFFTSMRFLRVWAKKDPLLRDVFIRYIRYVRKQALYPSRPSAFSAPKKYIWKQK
ncbi:MAG: VirB3 family type IV secretion system protein [Deltaproteobacteria bacterium]|jgi:type IV secretion system protein VirB3|nr:VirB3 family type IV secretion system protein [Deltaproteobacteria bacterium]